MDKTRLDELLFRKGLATDLHHAQGLIGAAKVLVNGDLCDKSGMLYKEDCTIQVKEQCPFVSRGGLKLQGGLDHFAANPTGLVCIDIGASSGGFTDCLLQNGAGKVYAVDVAYGMLDWKLRQDKRVIVIERFNARNITIKQIPEPIELAVIDAAFISLTKLIPPLLPLFGPEVAIICLIKPQFELARNLIPKGGVVTDPLHHQKAIDKITGFISEIGLELQGITPSPILGPKGNREFLISLGRTEH